MKQRRATHSDKPYKEAFVDFIKSLKWHWFGTIPIGLCYNDDDVLKRLRLIEAALCGTYLPNRFHKLPDDARFVMAVAFEGERTNGTRHAHILAYVPSPTKNCPSHSMLRERFPSEFRKLWKKVGLQLASDIDGTAELAVDEITFAPANAVRAIYAVKYVRQKEELSWSRFEFVTPPKFKTLENSIRNMITNRDRKRRAFLTKEQQSRAALCFDNHAVR